MARTTQKNFAVLFPLLSLKNTKCNTNIIIKITRSRWRLKRLRAEPPPQRQHPAKYSG